MRRARAALLASALTIGALVSSAQPSASQPNRQVILLLFDDLSFEDALHDPVLHALARSAGIGLMTTAAGGEPPTAEFATLGAGAVVGAPVGPVPVRTAGGAELVVDLRPFRAASGDAVPGALGQAIEDAGGSVTYLGGAPEETTEDSPGALVAVNESGFIDRGSIYEGFSAGICVDCGQLFDSELVVDSAPATSPESLRNDLAVALKRSPFAQVLIIATVAEPSPAMRARGDHVSPVVMATVAGDEIPRGAGVRGLTSDTTRREGVVANVDVAPTILEFLDVPIPGSMTGSPIRVAGEAPTELHTRYLEYQRVLRPVGVTLLLVALVSLVAGGALLLFAPGAPRRLVAALAVAGLFGVALQVAMLPGSYLPSFEVPLVFGVLAGAAGALTGVALAVGRSDRAFVPVVVVAAAGAVAVAVDAALGWASLLTPLLGGSALDGVRFYGLGNSYAGVVLAGVVLVAALLPTLVGTLLIAAAALFAGLPWIGADLGGGLTLFAVAGVWLALRVRGRLDLAAVGILVAAFVLGFSVIVGTHRLVEDATHVTRATTGSGGLLGIVETFWHRLRLNFEATVAAPAVWPALLGLPAWLVVAWRRAGPFAAPLQAREAWRDATIVLALGGILGYVLNDTFGMASIAFLYLSLAMVYPALAVRWKSA